MPGMTGYELRKKIKAGLSILISLFSESSVLKKIPMVIMSSENVLARVDQCLEEGAEDFIVKPVKLSDVRRLKDYMNRDLGPGSSKGNNDYLKRKQLHEGPDPIFQSSSLLSSSPTSPLQSSTPHKSLESPTRQLRIVNCDSKFSPL
ncbi:hypothetical protein SAY87_015773 [Trapa incisa]|uniref:Response regulatory domain-containing protein n=1 Tax=Trapa incisa TaxID=236973 RepID=A0AAN7L4V9_9MYRT|nr:hypothetical protein SAY87_015773 [Trapa incisa]